jgi:uncharacterized membrane protein
VTAAGTPPTRTGLDPRFAAALSYVGGLVTGVLFLILEKENRYVRFHAMQSTIAFLAVLVAHLLLNSAPIFGGLLSWIFVVVVIVVWVVLIFKAFKGEQYKLPYIGDWAEEQTR